MAPDEQISIAIPVTAEEFNRRRRRIVRAVIGAIAILAAAGYFTYRHYMDPIHAQEAYDDAKHLVAITRYSQAILACGRAISLKPDFGDAYLLRAQAYAAQRELEPAESDFTRLIQLEPNAARGYVGRCEVRYDFKDFNGAISDCGKAIQIDAGNARAYNLRGAALRAANQADRSLADLNRAVELAPDIDNLFQRAATLRALGKLDDAIADFDKAVFLFPGNAEVYRARAEAKRAMGDERGAQKDYEMSKSIEAR